MFQSRIIFNFQLLSKLTIITLVLVTLVIPLSAKADSPESINRYAAGDIQFCPKGKVYEDPSCSPKRTVMNDAISDAKTAAQNNGSGTIFIESGNYAGAGSTISDDEITFSHFDYGTSLTIQGGIGGGTTTFVRRLKFDNNADLDLTLMDVTVQPPDGTYTEHSIIINSSAGKVLLDNVNVQDSNRNGIYVNAHTGDITMQNVIVDNSNDTNIEIYAIEGSVYLNQVTSTNSQTGLGVALSDVRGKKGVNLTSVDSQDNFAINIYINGVTNDAKLTDCEVSGGVNGDGINITAVHGKKGVVIVDTNSNTNQSNNFSITNIDNAVSMVNVNANDSVGGPGIYIQNVDGKKGVSLNTVTASGNATYNMEFSTLEGDVTLSNVNASTAGGEGIYINDIGGKKGVTISDSTISGNTGNNLRMTSIINGAVTLTNLTANGSIAGAGINLQDIGGSKGVKLTNITADANYSYNLTVQYVTTGDFSYKTGECSNSVDSGGINLYSIGGRKGVSISGVDASSNAGTNLNISTVTGGVSFSSVNAHSSVNNRGMNIIEIYGSKGVSFKDSNANGNYGINMNFSGITGNVNLKNINAQNSTNGEGIYMNNILGTKGVSISTASTNGNQNDGISLENITGSVTMKVVESSSNTAGKGIDLSNIDGSKGVSLSDITANDNSSSNIWIASVDGDAVFKTIAASTSKNAYGLNINNVGGSKGVTMSGVTAEGNEDGNVILNTIMGNVSLKDIIANGSVSSAGIGMQHIYGSKGIKASNIAASSSGGSNIYISDVTGDVSLAEITATDGGSSGCYINAVSGNKGVAIKTGDFSSASLDNLSILGVSPGYVVLSGITGNSSTYGNGMVVSSVNGVLMLVGGTFNSNNQSGIKVSSQSGQVSITSVEANSNVNGDGANITSNNNQLICSSTFNTNISGYGLYSAAPGYSLTTSLVTHTGNAVDFTHTGAYYSDSTKCKVVPVPPP